jgi:hypothetical protein
MKFGLNQILHPTPVQVKKAFNTFFAITSITALALQCFPQIPQYVNNEVNQWVVSGNAFAWGLSKMFGVDAHAPGN